MGETEGGWRESEGRESVGVYIMSFGVITWLWRLIGSRVKKTKKTAIVVQDSVSICGGIYLNQRELG